MAHRPATWRPRGALGPAEAAARYDAERRAALETRRLYSTARWQAIREEQLIAEPLCRLHLAAGVYVAATVCDHIEPHHGDVGRFWAGPFQSLCAPCHSAIKQRQERGGRRR